MRLVFSLKLLAALWCLVLVSAVALVWVAYDTREQINRLLILKSQENQLRVAHGQYLLQERSLSSSVQLEIAATSLGLRFPEHQDIEVLSP